MEKLLEKFIEAKEKEVDLKIALAESIARVTELNSMKKALDEAKQCLEAIGNKAYIRDEKGEELYKILFGDNR